MSDYPMQQSLFDEPPAPAQPLNTVELLDYLLDEKRIRMVDVKLALMLCDNQQNDVFYIVLLLCLAQQSQHSCLTLKEVDWQNPFNLRQSDFTKTEGNVPNITSPFNEAFNYLDALSCLSAHNSVGEAKPLQLFNERLYFARLADYEHTLATRLLAMSERHLNINTQLLSQLLNDYFVDNSALAIDWQKVACAIAATKGFSAVSYTHLRAHET